MGLDILIYVNDIPNDKLTQMVSSVEVNEQMDQNTTYKLIFEVDICDGDIAKSIQDDTSPNEILSVFANVKDELVCLVKGPVTRQKSHLNHGGAGSWMHIEGEDTGHNLDLKPKFRETKTGSDADIATNIISGSTQMIPDVERTPDSTHNENNHSHIQRESDLSLLRTLARRNGFHFWITYSKIGLATGHFKSRSLDGEPEVDLIVNLDNYNIESLEINSDPDRPTTSQGMQLNLRTKKIIDRTVKLEDTVLGDQGLADVTSSDPLSMYLGPSVDDEGAMEARIKGALREAQWFIKATCKTSLHRLGNIVRTHTIVNVDGAGSKHSGKYYVTGVKHNIDAASHIMDLEMERNGWGE